MPAPLFPVETHSDLPTHADVVVIGGGIIGTFAAYYLVKRKRGMKVALVEKGRIGAEQSSRNWGWCRHNNRTPCRLRFEADLVASFDGIQHGGVFDLKHHGQALSRDVVCRPVFYSLAGPIRSF